MRQTCDHGVPLGAPCDDATCYNHQSPRPAVAPQPRRDPDADLVDGLSARSVRIDPSRFDPDAVRTWTTVEAYNQTLVDSSGDLTHGKGAIGKAPDGERLPVGSSSWEYLRVVGYQDGVPVRQDQPVFVKGAVYPGAAVEAKARRERTETEAQRIIAQRELKRVDLGSVTTLTPRQMERRASKRAGGRR